jgi:hypothetical protein
MAGSTESAPSALIEIRRLRAELEASNARFIQMTQFRSDSDRLEAIKPSVENLARASAVPFPSGAAVDPQRLKTKKTQVR